MTRMNKIKLITLSTCVMLVSACSNVPATPKTDIDLATHTVVIKPEVLTQIKIKTEELDKTNNEVVEVKKDELNIQYPEDYHNFVQKKGKAISSRAIQYYNKGYEYKSYIETVAEKNDLPEEIFALAAMESNFNTKIKSNSGALGMWQLMPALGRDMGLVVNGNVDERKDWKKSTDAALEHLGQTKVKFQSDELAILSYYSGVGKVNKAVKRNNTTDVWVLLQDKRAFSKSEKEYLYTYMAYAKEFKKLNSKYDKYASK
jgi:membrane-bound lytic murein transglycosylase D